jgi:hypothetical protein
LPGFGVCGSDHSLPPKPARRRVTARASAAAQSGNSIKGSQKIFFSIRSMIVFIYPPK